MKNPDTETILGARTDRLQRETVDGVHEQIKYIFKLILLKKWYRWGAGDIASLWPYHRVLNDPVPLLT